MADPMTREKLRDLLSDMECGAGPDGGDIMAACDDLIAQERAEVERLRAELDEARRGKVDQMLGRLDDWSGDLATVVADRDRLAGQVKALADEWDETITSGVMRGQEWEQCLRANLPRLRAALGGTEAGR